MYVSPHVSLYLICAPLVCVPVCVLICAPDVSHEILLCVCVCVCVCVCIYVCVCMCVYVCVCEKIFMEKLIFLKKIQILF